MEGSHRPVAIFLRAHPAIAGVYQLTSSSLYLRRTQRTLRLNLSIR